MPCPATPASSVGGVRGPVRKRILYHVRLGDEDVYVATPAEALQLLKAAKATARNTAPLEAKKAASQELPPPEPPRMQLRYASPESDAHRYQAQIDAANAQIALIYQRAAVIAELIRDDEELELLITLGVL